MSEFKIKPPYYGCEYSPELTESSEIDFDIAMMEKSGFNLVRIGDHGWNIIEKNKGGFDFSFYRQILKKLSQKNIGAVFSFPVFAPPMWLKKEKKTYCQDDSVFFCPSDENIVKSSLYMIRETLKNLSDCDNILFWNITVPDFGRCSCINCRRRFSDYLSEKYNGSIEKLNYTLINASENSFYSSFDEIAEDKDRIFSDSALYLEWERFGTATILSLLKNIRSLVRAESRLPFAASFSYDFPDIDKIFDVSDIPSVYYDYIGNNEYFPLLINRFSKFKIKKFFVFTSFDNLGSCPMGKGAEGYHRFRAFLPYLAGADGSLYWFFRNRHVGDKSECDALLSSEGRPSVHCSDAISMGTELRKAERFLNNTRSFSSVALQYSSFSKKFFSVNKNFRITDYESLLFNGFYQPIHNKGLETDIIDNADSLSEYKLLFSPMTVTFEEGIGIKKIDEWVRNGGIWVCGPLSDIRDSNGIKYKRSPFGNLEGMVNAYLFYRLYSEKPLKAMWRDEKPFEGGGWYDIFEKSENDLVLMSDEYKEFANKSLVKISSVGKGKIILLGTFPSSEDMEKIIDIALTFAKVKKVKCSENIFFSSRKGYDDFGREYKGIVLAECKGKEGSVRLPKAYVDLFSGKMVKGIFKLEPYGVHILEEIDDD